MRNLYGNEQKRHPLSKKLYIKEIVILLNDGPLEFSSVVLRELRLCARLLEAAGREIPKAKPNQN